MYYYTEPQYDGLGISFSPKGVWKKARTKLNPVRLVRESTQSFWRRVRRPRLLLKDTRRVTTAASTLGTSLLYERYTKRQRKFYKRETNRTAAEMVRTGKSQAAIAAYRDKRHSKLIGRRHTAQRATKVAAAVVAVTIVTGPAGFGLWGTGGTAGVVGGGVTTAAVMGPPAAVMGPPVAAFMGPPTAAAMLTPAVAPASSSFLLNTLASTAAGAGSLLVKGAKTAGSVVVDSGLLPAVGMQVLMQRQQGEQEMPEEQMMFEEQPQGWGFTPGQGTQQRPPAPVAAPASPVALPTAGDTAAALTFTQERERSRLQQLQQQQVQQQQVQQQIAAKKKKDTRTLLIVGGVALTVATLIL